MAASHTWLLAAALAVAAPLATSVRAVDEWELLGSRRVSFSAERDVIEVGAEEGAYRTIKIEVEGGNLEMFDIRLFFGDGGTWSPATRVRFREGSWSRTIDLPGPGRVIRRIEFAYRSELRQGRATVRVYGNSAGPAPVSPPARTVGDWELLGSRRVSFSGERDVLDVGAREGAYRAIKLEVEGGNLEMYDIRLIFGDGGTWSPETRVRFREGSWSRTIDLPDRGRVIRKVEFAYRSELRRGRATVRVYGKSAEPGRPGMRGYRDREGRRDGEDPRDNPHPDRRVMEGPPAGGPGVAGWEHLGARQVDFRLDHDAVVAGGRGVFRRLRIDVEGNDLEMFSVKVTFGNGATFSPPTRLIFKEGSRSRVIDLPGTARVIRRIDFYYRSTSGVRRGRSTVHVYGRG